MLFSAALASSQENDHTDHQEAAASGGPLDSLRQSVPLLPELKWHSMFTNIPLDYSRFVSWTFRAERVPVIAGMTVLTAGLIATDNETWNASNAWYQGSRRTQTLSDIFVYIGDGRPQFGLAAGFAAWGFVAHDQRSLRTGSEMVEAILACGIVVQTLKHVTGRESPFVSTRAGGRWIPFPNQIQYAKHVPHFDAYPSGHIATALATVTVVAENYPEWGWAKPLGYSLVTLLGISMANTGIHWYSDYPLGLFLGYSFGLIAAHPGGLPTEIEEFKNSHVQVAPMVGEFGEGVTVSMVF